MEPIRLMVNGMPGNMARIIARHVLADARFDLVPFSLTGPEIEQPACEVEGVSVKLVRPEARKEAFAALKADFAPFMAVDYTHPTAVNGNAEFYCDNGVPFVMGTTGGDRESLMNTVARSKNAAVIAPNMAKQIVGFQAMMEYAAQTFPGLFSGYSIDVTESHQQAKADTSGTAKAMVRYFSTLGTPCGEADIHKIREPEEQKKLGVPEEYLSGHGWHTYTLTSGDGTVTFAFTHNVNGREVYAPSTLDAALFLAEKVAGGAVGKVFSMIDVLKGV